MVPVVFGFKDYIVALRAGGARKPVKMTTRKSGQQVAQVCARNGAGLASQLATSHDCGACGAHGACGSCL